MKTNILKVLSFFLLSLAVVSCGTLKKVQESMPSKGYELGSSSRLNGKVLVTVNNHQALVVINSIDSKTYTLSESPVVYLVTPDNCKEYLFDNLTIRGLYYFIGTHRYKTVNKEFDQYKTVPVFIEKKYYSPGMEWNDWSERIDTAKTTGV